MTTKEFALMIDHDHWANQRITSQLQNLSAIPEKAERFMNHIIGAQNTWISRINGAAPMMDVWPSLMVDHWDSLFKKNHHMLIEIIADEKNLARIINYTNTKGDVFSNPVSELIIHLCLHSQYHRGQVVTICRDLIESPLPTDMIAFLRV
ncbi:MAG: DinB family protein [Flavobacteriales bacterium]